MARFLKIQKTKEKKAEVLKNSENQRKIRGLKNFEDGNRFSKRRLNFVALDYDST